MSSSSHFLVSLEPRHARNILAGKKHVELRRRAMKVPPGATMWIYAKLPIGSIIGGAVVGGTETASPNVLWRRYGTVSGLTKLEFFDYFKGMDRGTALILGARFPLKETLPLNELRELVGGFQPPQFFSWLAPSNPVRHAVVRASASNAAVRDGRRCRRCAASERDKALRRRKIRRGPQLRLNWFSPRFPAAPRCPDRRRRRC